MNAIVAVDNNWAIGYKGELLFHIKDDLQHFKKFDNGRHGYHGSKDLRFSTWRKGSSWTEKYCAYS